MSEKTALPEGAPAIPNEPANPGSVSSRMGFGLLAPKSIRSKLVISLVLTYVLGSLAAIAALYSISRVESKIELVELFYELNQKILETRRYEKNFLLYGNPEDIISAQNYLEEVRAAIVRLHAMGVLSPSVAMARQLHDAKLSAYADLLQQLGKPGLTEENRTQLTEVIHYRGHALTQSVLEMDTMARHEVEEEAKRYRDTALTILGTILVLGPVLTTVLVQWIVGPLESIRRAAVKIMRGELTAITLEPERDRSTECVELVDSLNQMLQTLRNKHEQFVQSAKLAAIGKVTAGIAHEINNPLNNIFLTAETLLDDLPNIEAADRIEMIHDILHQADRAREVVSHLLEFSRFRKPTAWEKVDLHELAKETLVLLKNQLRLERIEVATDFPEVPVTAMGNKNQLQQVLVNIILNAIQATGPCGLLGVRVGLDLLRDKAVMEVKDNGPGITEEIKAQIFDPFFSTKNSGFGLGLYVCHSIVKEHKGDIEVESSPDQGTAFRIFLPRHRVES